MIADFDKAFKLIIGAEGGYSNDPNDSGGATKYGISQKAYPYLDIKSLTIDDAKKIYKRDYWDYIHGDEIPFPICTLMFDEAVNQGTGAAIMDLQRACGLSEDGVFGIHTLEAAKKLTKEQLTLYLANRAMRYTHTRNVLIYGKGWFKRLFNIVIECSQ